MKPIIYRVGDAVYPEGPGPKIIPHVVNDLGVWGAGFVLALSARWPEPEDRYRRISQSYAGRDLPLGSVHFSIVEADTMVANLVAQHGVGRPLGQRPINYQALIVGRQAQLTKSSVHMPRLGCGLAGGDWGMVGQIVEGTLSALDLEVFVYDLPMKEAA
jgi:O-acetyl-ADP-ribose deacetylase (regulator of RNase III)